MCLREKWFYHGDHFPRHNPKQKEEDPGCPEVQGCNQGGK